MMETFKDKTIAVTGGLGSIGSNIIQKMLTYSPEKILLLDNRETGLFYASEYSYDDRIHSFFCDIRDSKQVKKMLKNVDAVYHCTPPNSMIISNGIPKAISTLEISDKVLTHHGRFREISNKFKREISEDIIEIKLKLTNIPVRITKEHPILVWRPTKRCPKAYRKLCTPACKSKERERCPKHYLKDYLQWIPAKEIMVGDYVVYPRFKKRKHIKLNSDIFRLIGYYLAEGCLSSKNSNGHYYSVKFSFNENEIEWIQDVKNILLSQYNKNSSEYNNNHETTITVSSRKLSDFFMQFGMGAKNKMIPIKYLSASDKQITQLLLGYYRGDGEFKNGRMTTTSKFLAYQLRILFNRLGIPVRLFYFEKKPSKKNYGRFKIKHRLPVYEIAISKSCSVYPFKLQDSYYRSFCWIDDEYVYIKVDCVEKRNYIGNVFNIEVEDDNSYCIEGIATHNCAAMKHVVVCEKNPFETVKTNVIGTQNVIEACLDNQVNKMILINTDKAVNPTNVMGATKLLAERLVSSMCNIRREDDTKFGIVRFGNVLYSRGSVLEIWNKQLEKGEKITVTNPSMTRFFMDVDQSIDLIFTASQYAENGETFILKMPSIEIKDLVEAFLEINNYDSNYYQIIGSRPGEKLHEELLLETESTPIFENEKFFLKSPLQIGKNNFKYAQIGFKKSTSQKLKSNNPKYLIDKKIIKEVLKNTK